MAEVTTSKAINLPQLTSEVGVGLVAEETAEGLRITQETGAALAQPVLQNAVDAHVADPDWGVPQEVIRLRGQVDTLRQWANDARTVGVQGANVSQAQLKTMFNRLGTLMDRLADLLVADGRN